MHKEFLFQLPKGVTVDSDGSGIWGFPDGRYPIEQIKISVTLSGKKTTVFIVFYYSSAPAYEYGLPYTDRAFEEGCKRLINDDPNLSKLFVCIGSSDVAFQDDSTLWCDAALKIEFNDEFFRMVERAGGIDVDIIR